MKVLSLIIFFVFFISCNSSQVNDKPRDDSCKKNIDCPSYNFCIDKKCKDYSSNDFSSIEELKTLSLSNFIIMSDNKGDSIEDKRFENMVNWAKDFSASFVIGLGDHLKINYENQFLGFLEKNEFWFNNFYPSIADGENEYYGESQADWGAGGKFLEFLKFSNRSNTILEANKVEYYSKFKAEDLTIHLIQLHFPDQPLDDKIAWPQSSRDYLIKTIKSINKSKNDIIIVGAHSIFGRWYQYLSEDEFKVVIENVDLGLSATSHIFEKYKIESYENKGTLFLNTGAVSRPRFPNGEGFVYVFVLDNPNRIVLQYLDPRKPSIEFDTRYPLYIKNIAGTIEEKIIKN